LLQINEGNIFFSYLDKQKHREKEANSSRDALKDDAQGKFCYFNSKYQLYIFS